VTGTSAGPPHPRCSVVIPTVGRPGLDGLVAAVSSGPGPLPGEVILVDDRPGEAPALPVRERHVPLRILRSGGRGPAAARNVGWRAAAAEWVAFVDDDVRPDPGWPAALASDLDGLPELVAGCQGRLRVPLPTGRRPTDDERNVAGLEQAPWITADLAYRRVVLEEVGGFDERFPRAYREDADLGLRVTAAGYVIVAGDRTVEHPVGPTRWWASVKRQAGNADDVLMRARHGAGWRLDAGTPPGRNGRHLATTGAAVTAVAALVTGRRRAGLAALAGWVAGTAGFAAHRIAPGPRTPREVAAMVATSAAIPPAALGWSLRGLAQLPAHLRDTLRAPLGLPRSPLALSPAPVLAPASQRPRARRVDPAWTPAAVLFDRDGTLIVDLPGNRDPDRVCLMPGARTAVTRARQAGLRVGVVTNQAAVGRGEATLEDVAAMNARVEELLGPFDTWQVCPHRPEDGCDCRKPQPGMVAKAAAELGVEVGRCAVVGDIIGDVRAGLAAGGRGVLVPTRRTRRAEVGAAPVVAPDLLSAVDLVLAGLA
jgi:histidinol-phosphate phosphatase family protein